MKTIKGKSLPTYLLVLFLLLAFPTATRADAFDDPLLSKVMLDQLEQRFSGDIDSVSWSAQGWLGYDLNKLWFKSEVEHASGMSSESELQALYSVATAPFWDFQAGFRKDWQAGSSKQWAVLGLQGLAPYFFEVDMALFIADAGQAAFRLEAEYDLLLSQKLILSPEIEANFYAQNNVLTGTGSGLSEIEFGLRLRYEIVREFAPYVGVNWSKRFSNSADFARAAGESVSNTQVVLGFKVWF